jgi:hypothetical protein
MAPAATGPAQEATVMAAMVAGAMGAAVTVVRAIERPEQLAAAHLWQNHSIDV